MIEYFKMAVTEKYAQFDGRSTRSEYWYFVLAYMLIAIAVCVVIGMLAFILGDSGGVISMILFGALLLGGLALIVPSIALSIRRLHDTGKSGWWYLIAFVPLGSIVLLVFMCLESQPGPNEYGPNPFELDSGDDISGHLVQEDLV